MKRKSKIMLKVIFAFVILWCFLFIIDYIRTLNNREPMFAIYSDSYEDGGSKKYTGLFYNVYYLHYENPETNRDWYNEDGSIKDEYKDKEYIIDYKISSWFVKIDKVKE